MTLTEPKEPEPMFEYRPYESDCFVIGYTKDDKTFEGLFYCFNEYNAAKLAEMLNETAAMEQAQTSHVPLPGQQSFDFMWN